MKVEVIEKLYYIEQIPYETRGTLNKSNLMTESEINEWHNNDLINHTRRRAAEKQIDAWHKSDRYCFIDRIGLNHSLTYSKISSKDYRNFPYYPYWEFLLEISIDMTPEERTMYHLLPEII